VNVIYITTNSLKQTSAYQRSSVHYVSTVDRKKRQRRSLHRTFFSKT